MDEHDEVLPLHAERPPPRVDEGGVVRVGNSRISLDLVVEQYESGMTPDDMVRAYDTLVLELRPELLVFQIGIHSRKEARHGCILPCSQETLRPNGLRRRSSRPLGAPPGRVRRRRGRRSARGGRLESRGPQNRSNRSLCSDGSNFIHLRAGFPQEGGWIG